MKKYFLSMAFAAAVLLTNGCVRTSTLEWMPAQAGEVSSSGKEVAYHLKARNCGLYLFYYIPIWSGKVSRPNRKDYELWEDMVNEWDMRRLLDREIKRLGAAGAEDVRMESYSSGMWTLWIFWKRSMTATAVAVKKAPDAKKTATK